FMTVARILAEKGGSVVTVPPHRTVDEAIHLLAEKRIGALVVGDAGGRVIGDQVAGVGEFGVGFVGALQPQSGDR
ncbi:CBS domain-containing protein, partial [Burkholderia pseudomallei]